uniref:Uncharacterized protein n=1 Tax=Trypanosoma vivax (strain Y486) TaxID=1055687 RepID=G0TY16_TRYVY|nr:hypothetical protein TVY486_0701980 [Trypanosoma vivax Y486]
MEQMSAPLLYSVLGSSLASTAACGRYCNCVLLCQCGGRVAWKLRCIDLSFCVFCTCLNSFPPVLFFAFCCFVFPHAVLCNAKGLVKVIYSSLKVRTEKASGRISLRCRC